MGLHVHNLGNLPADSEREYFIYMLDYGWHEPLSEAMRANFTNMARLASKSKSVVIAGVEPIHFENEVFSYHGINGEHGEDILPALMVATLHPRYFKEHNCRVPDDQMSYRSYPLLAASELLKHFIRERVHEHQTA